jgi:hypothetical protein
MKTYSLTSRYYNGLAPYNYSFGLPRQYKIVGSNDGVTWTSIQDAQFSAAPITTAATITTYSQTTANYSIVTTTSAITQQSNNSITGYANALNAYSYFRIIVRAIMGTNLGFTNPASDTRANFFWNVNFTPATSSVSMALDPGVPNQLNIGGSLNINGLTLGGPIFVSASNATASPAIDGTTTMNMTTHFPGAVMPQGTLFLVRLSSTFVFPTSNQINVTFAANINNAGWNGIGACQHLANADYTYFGDMVPFYNAGGQGPIQFGIFLRFFNTFPAAGAYPIGSLTISVYKIF